MILSIGPDDSKRTPLGRRPEADGVGRRVFYDNLFTGCSALWSYCLWGQPIRDGRREGQCMTRSCSTSKQIVYLALAGNILVTITKMIAAVATGSAAMLSEAIHSLVDSANEGLLLYGYRMAVRRPDNLHPLGYGRELYFWSFIVALLLFGLGAGVSLYEGVQHILAPRPIDHPFVSYVVLACAFVFEGASWLAAFLKLRATRGDLGYWEAVHKSKDPPSFMVLFEDSAALTGIVIAALGIYLSQKLALPILDGVASVLIGWFWPRLRPSWPARARACSSASRPLRASSPPWSTWRGRSPAS